MGTQEEDKPNKIHSTICVEHHHTQTNTNNVNKTSYKQLGVMTNRTLFFMRKS